MWEITIKGKPSDIVYFLELKNTLKDLFKKDILVVITFEKDLLCSVATINSNIISHSKRIVWETIIKIVKIEYMQENLNCFTQDKSLNSFLLSNLIMLDIKDEIEYAIQTVKLSKILSIRSFIYFKLHNFIELWKREVDYLNKHFSGENEENYLGFLKFLANNSSPKSDIMYLQQNKSEMLLLDKKGKKLKILEKNDDIGIIANLVMYAPKKLIINCIDSLSQKVSSLISYIFEDRVSVLL